MNKEEKIEAALTALQQNQHKKAATLCASLLEETPEDAEILSFHGLALLPADPSKAIISLEMATLIEPQEPQWHLHHGLGWNHVENWEKAERAFASAVHFSKGAPQTLLLWSNALQKTGRLPEAADALLQVTKTAPSKNVLWKLGTLQNDLGDYAGALHSFEQALNSGAATAEEKLAIGHLQVTMQHFDQAAETYNTLLYSKPVNPDAALGAANIARARGDMTRADEFLLQGWHDNKHHSGLTAELLEASDVDPNVLSAAQSQVTNDATALIDKQILNFALAKYFDRTDDPEQAWQYATNGNSQYDDPEAQNLQKYEHDIEMAVRLFEKIKPASYEDHSPDLLYCIGPPRSGGSLLQTVLSAPEGHASLGERGALMPWVLPMLNSHETEALAEWKSKATDLSKADLAGMRSLNTDATLYTDKTPHHAHVAGLIYRLHPQAKFIDQRRNLKDVLVSIYLHGFKSTFLYSRNVKLIADYLVLHRQTMDRWGDVGVPVTVHDHEAFVRTPEDTGANLFDRLGLVWHDNYLKRDNRKTTVRTFSVRQVREKISPAFSGKGEKYSDFIGSLPAAFEELL